MRIIWTLYQSGQTTIIMKEEKLKCYKKTIFHERSLLHNCFLEKVSLAVPSKDDQKQKDNFFEKKIHLEASFSHEKYSECHINVSTQERWKKWKLGSFKKLSILEESFLPKIVLKIASMRLDHNNVEILRPKFFGKLSIERSIF